jgi:hypothetical protein
LSADKYDKVCTADLLAIGRYIVEDNPERAVSFLAELENKAINENNAKSSPFLWLTAHSRLDRRSFIGGRCDYRPGRLRDIEPNSRCTPAGAPSPRAGARLDPENEQ